MRLTRTTCVLAVTATVVGAAAVMAASQSQPVVLAAAATALPELTSATPGTTTTNSSGAKPFQQTTVTFAFDATVTTAAPVAADFHLVGFDSNWRADGASAATQADGKSVLVTFGTSTAPIADQQILDTSIASVSSGAVTGTAGTAPDGAVPLGTTQTLTPTAGKTAAPDLLSVTVGGLASPSPSNPSATNTDVTFTFDQPAYVTNTGSGHLVMNDGSSTSTCTYDSGSNTSGTTSLTMLCSDPTGANNVPVMPPIATSNVARAYVDPRLVSADPQNASAGQAGPQGVLNPLEAATVSGPGSNPKPHLTGITYHPGVTVTDGSGFGVTADQVDYKFDQPVTVGAGTGPPSCAVNPAAPQPTGGCFLVTRADGSEAWAADPNDDGPAISGVPPQAIADGNGQNTIVVATFPAGTLQGAVGAAVATGAVTQPAPATASNDGDWISQLGSGSVSLVPGTTNGPILIGIRVNGAASPATATYVFDEDLTPNSLTGTTTKQFYLADPDGTKLQCQSATQASGGAAGTNNTVTCTSYQAQVATPGTATDAQITQATEGYVDHNSVTASLPAETIAGQTGNTRATQNPETAIVVIGAPMITQISPTSGSADGGTVVTITGTNFTNATAVNFGTTAATTFSVVNPTTITATSPQHDIGAVDVTVTTPQGKSQTSSADTFTYVAPSAAPPQVTGVTPSHGPPAGGTKVQISGSGLKGATAVHFGSNVAKFQVVNDKTINAIAPPHSLGSVHVTVRTPNGPSPKSTADTFTYSRTHLIAILRCTSPHKHVVKCKVRESPAFSGLKVVFKKRVNGQWTKWDVARTNSRGNATLLKRGLPSGKRLVIKAIVHGNVKVSGTHAGPNRVRVE